MASELALFERDTKPAVPKRNFPSQRNQLFLDTKGSCFLCLQECSSDFEASLKSIWQFLKISPSSILLQTLKENYDLCEEESSALRNSNRNVTVTLCTTCELLSTSLSKLISQLEVTKMLVEYKFQELNQILRATQMRSNGGAWEKARKKMLEGAEDEDGSVDVDTVKKLRLEAQQKCSQIASSGVTKRVPKVVLQRLTPEEIMAPVQGQATPLPEDTSDSIDNPNTLPNTTSIPNPPARRTRSSLTPSSILRDSKGNTTPSKSALASKLLSSNYTTSASPPTLNCLHCDFTLPQGSNFKRSMERHIETIHPETLFASLKPPHLSTLVFRDACVSLLSSEAQVGVKRSSASGIPCPYCPTKYSHSKSLRQHLVLDHFENLTRKLQKFVEPVVPPSSSDDRPFEKVSVDLEIEKQYTFVPPENGFQCRHCPYLTKKLTFIRNHVARMHPEVLLAHTKLAETSDPIFKEACRGMLTAELTVAKQSAGSQVKAAVVLAFCKYCEDDKATRYCGASLRCHLVAKHFEVVEGKMREYQREGGYHVPNFYKPANPNRKRRREDGNETVMTDDSLLSRNGTQEFTLEEDIWEGSKEEFEGLGKSMTAVDELSSCKKVKVEREEEEMEIDWETVAPVVKMEEDQNETLIIITSTTGSTAKCENAVEF